MRIVIIVMNDVIYQPRIYNQIIPRLIDKVVGIGIVPIIPPAFSKWRYIKHHIVLFGLNGFIIKGIKSLLYRFIALFDHYRRKDFKSIEGIGYYYGIPVIRSNDVNNKQFIESVKLFKPDIIISSCSHIFRMEILRVSRLGVINTHAGMLPKYRGVYPIFWAMLNNDKEFGITVHYMAKKIDAGPIIIQKNFAIGHNDTFESLLDKLVSNTPDLLIGAIQKIEDNCAVETFENDISIGSYFSFPNREDMKRFKKMGKKIR